MADDREELDALRRLAELESKAGGAAAPAVPSAPGSQPLPPLSQRLGDIGMAGVRGLVSGGGNPLAGIVGAAGEGFRQSGEALDRGAYKAGGAVTDVLAPHVPPEVAAGAGYAANVGTQAIPAVLGGLLGKATQPAFQSGGKRLMQSALKPLSKDIASGAAEKGVKTLLEEGANVSGGGAQKLQTMIDALNRDVTQRVATSPAMVDKGHAAGEVMGTLGKFRQQVNPVADESAILNAWKEFSGRYPAKIPIQQAQAVKQGTYKALAGKYGEVGSASTEAQKALARGLRKGIEEQIPEVKLLNMKESELINALNQVERRVGIGANRDIGGLAWIANDPKAAAAFFAGRSELFKSIVARMLYSGSGPAATAAGASAGGAVGAMMGQPEQ